MSKELRPCPFCGGTKICTEKGTNINYCDNCSAESNVGHWNTRPIEDNLIARIVELEAENEKINYFFRRLRMFCIFAHWDNPNTEAEFCKVDAEIREYLSEYKACIDQLTAHDATERQDDKSPNDTQTQTIVYGKWIPVGERLPECEKDVLVFWGKASDGSKIDWFGTAWRNECDDGKWCTDPIVPTHWMPLPEPPIVYGKESEE